MRMLVVVAMLVALLSCTSENVSPSGPPATHAPTSSVTAPCPVTLPDGAHRAGDPAGLGDQGYGNGELWVGLWPKGHARAAEDNMNASGEIVMKFPWDRGTRGRLEITGQRLDADAAPLRARLTNYGASGFQPSALIFPTEGCWKVTGTVGRSSLTFVTRVTLPR